ncbi:MAG: Asp-tRNA(Asn)/Glu-tRNA(Gln) amidotransferase subunit GatC [Xanthomonadaceae bacterium]|nr:Asp-tRNA(Asn)/Glu-tRNA(Gln) amidotransferase subunit GatC [Xanthomonadaceae bacterium]
MLKVDQAWVKKIADLARLDLSDEEMKKFTNQFEEMMKYVDAISDAKVDGVEPMIHPYEMELLLRDDVPDAPFVDSEGKPKVLQSAPETLYEGYKVPPIL